MATFEEQSDLVVDQIQDRSSQADSTLQLTLNAIDATRMAIAAAVNLLVANAISISVTGVDTTYVPATAVAPTVPAIPALPTVPNLPSAPTVPSAPALPTVPSAPTAPTAPSLPTVPTLPTGGAIAIGQADWDAAYLRAMGLQDRIMAKNLAEGANRALWRGHAEWDESLAVLAADATDKGDMEDSQNALASAWDQAKALREDAIAIAKLDVDLYGTQSQAEIGAGKLDVDVYGAQSQTEIGLGKLEVDLYGTESQSEIGLGRLEVDLYEAQSRTEIANFSSLAAETRQYYIQGWTLAVDNYQKQWATKTQSEIGRLGYERLELDKSVGPERIRAEYDLKKTEIAQKNAVGELVDLIQTYAQITTALISGSDVSLGSGVSMGLTPTVYNPGEGDVVLYPA